jgi:hypothetical protein
MRINTNRHPKTQGGAKAKSKLIKLQDEHSFAINADRQKARALEANIKKVKNEFRLHEAMGEYRKQIAELDAQIKAAPKGSTRANQLKMFRDTKKKLLRKMESKTK